MATVGDIEQVRALDLVIVRSYSNGGHDDLVSLACGAVLASGQEIHCDDSVPVFGLTENAERQACDMAGVPYGGGWPGWDVMVPYLRVRVRRREWLKKRRAER
jgi:hypothetical protein